MTAAKSWLYQWCYVLEVYDGDTIKVDIDKGENQWSRNRRVRLAGINCPELHLTNVVPHQLNPAGEAAQAFTASLIKVGDRVVVKSYRLDEYGRIYGDVFTLDDPDVSVSSKLLAAGQAVVDK